jgi:hypothetical protein
MSGTAVVAESGSGNEVAAEGWTEVVVGGDARVAVGEESPSFFFVVNGPGERLLRKVEVLAKAEEVVAKAEEAEKRRGFGLAALGRGLQGQELVFSKHSLYNLCVQVQELARSGTALNYAQREADCEQKVVRMHFGGVYLLENRLAYLNRGAS